MVFKISRFAMFCVFSASYTPGSRSEPHPLCRTLSNREELQPTHFPSAYTCNGDDDDVICTPRSTEALGASDRKLEPGAVTWWVYEGRRQLVSSAAEDTGVDEWVDCTDYYARRSPAVGPSKLVGTPPRRSSEKISKPITTSDGFLREQNPSAGRETTPSLPISQELRALQAQGARG